MMFHNHELATKIRTPSAAVQTKVLLGWEDQDHWEQLHGKGELRIWSEGLITLIIMWKGQITLPD